MQEKKPIEELFRDRLREAETAPPAFVWENVAADLARRQRRRLLGFWLGGGVTAAGLATAAWLIFSKNETNQIQKIEQPVAASIFEKNEPVEPTASPIFLEKKEAAPRSNFEKTASSKISNSKLGLKKEAVFSEKLTPEKTTQLIENQAIISEKTEVAPPIFEQSQLKKTVVFKNETEAEAIPFLPTEILSFSFQKPPRPEHPTKYFKTKKQKPRCPSFAERGQAWLLDVYAGPAVAFKTLAEKQGTDSQSYAAQRRNTERSAFAWSAGARGALLFAGKYSFRAGLNYTQIHEKFDFYDPEYAEVFIHIDPQGNRDTTILYGEHFVRTQNRYGFLDLPLTFGVEVGRGPLGLSLNGGAAVNLVFWKRGDILSPIDGQPVAFSPLAKTHEKVFKANAGLSLVASAQAFYQINKNTRVFVEPYFQRILKSVTLPSHPVEQKYGVGGVSFGLTYLIK